MQIPSKDGKIPIFLRYERKSAYIYSALFKINQNNLLVCWLQEKYVAAVEFMIN